MARAAAARKGALLAASAVQATFPTIALGSPSCWDHNPLLLAFPEAVGRFTRTVDQAMCRPTSLFRFSILVSAIFVVTGAWAFAQERVSFDSLDDGLFWAPTRLAGVLFKPEGEGPFPAVVGMHGCGGLFNKKGAVVARETAWAHMLTERGYVVLFPDSFGSRGVTKACADGGPDARPWAERSEDAYAALLYLQSLLFVIGDRVALMGWSHGG